MDIRDLEVLAALEEHRHFARAASAVGISQPAFSGRIQKLEQTLGIPIVQRGVRFEEFTKEGEAILRWARRILTDMRGLHQDLSQMRETLADNITVGVIPSALHLAGELTAALVADHPNVKIFILSLTSIEIQRRLDACTLDAGISYLDNEPLQRIRGLPLYRESYRLVASESIIAPNPKGIGWQEAAQLPLALLGEDMQFRRIINSLFLRANGPVSPLVTSNNFSALLGHVRGGHAATVMPEKVAGGSDMTGLHTSPLIDPVETHIVGLVVPDRDPLLPVTQELWRTAKAMAEV